MDSKPILEVKDLAVKLRLGASIYPVVRKISFELYPGRTLALVGESGCGKTITALSILKLLQIPILLPIEGEISYRGKNLVTMSEKELQSIRGGEIGVIFQDPTSALNPVYTIGDQLIEMAMRHLEIDEEEAYARSVEKLSSMGIPHPSGRMDDYPHQLSGGLKQRVMIAMALLCEPNILIADEPTTALDVTIQAQVLELIRELQKNMHLSVLLITHDMGVVAELANDVAVMYAGDIVENGSVMQIFDNPSHPYTLGLFESLKREGKKGFLKAIKGNVPTIQRRPSGCPFHTRCPFVFEKCYHGTVPPFEIAKLPPHRARCWLRAKG